jgi:hypothetical protein
MPAKLTKELQPIKKGAGKFSTPLSTYFSFVIRISKYGSCGVNPSFT